MEQNTGTKSPTLVNQQTQLQKLGQCGYVCVCMSLSGFYLQP